MTSLTGFRSKAAGVEFGEQQKGVGVPHYPSLKVVGWTSSYKSVQKYLNWLRKEKFDDQRALSGLRCIDLLCQRVGTNPDLIVALARKSKDRLMHNLDTLASMEKGLKEQDWDEKAIEFVTGHVVMFLSQNGVW